MTETTKTPELSPGDSMLVTWLFFSVVSGLVGLPGASADASLTQLYVLPLMFVSSWFSPANAPASAMPVVVVICLAVLCYVAYEMRKRPSRLCLLAVSAGVFYGLLIRGLVILAHSYGA